MLFEHLGVGPRRKYTFDPSRRMKDFCTSKGAFIYPAGLTTFDARLAALGRQRPKRRNQPIFDLIDGDNFDRFVFNALNALMVDHIAPGDNTI